MTLIRTSCPRCGEVEMRADAILLSVQHATGDAWYRFHCPSCTDAVEKRADGKIVALLLSAGVDMTANEEAKPAPVATLTRPTGPAFTPDDLLEFHFLLQDDDLIARELLAG